MHGTYPSGPQLVDVVQLDDPRWVAFVAANPRATPFHDPTWARLLAQCYRLSGSVLAHLDGAGAVQAGVPVLASPRLPGRTRRLVSLPFTDALAPLVPVGGGGRFAAALEGARRQLGVAGIDLRGPLDGARSVETRSVVHTLELGSDFEAVVAGFSRSARRNIRLAERRGIVVRRAREERDLTETFFALHLATRSRLGVPVQPKRFFHLLWQALTEAGLGFVLVAEQEGRPIASAVFLQDAGTVVYKYSASDSAALSSKPNDLLIATAIREACHCGCSRFDFGRSELATEGLRAFKNGFGAAEEPLVYAIVGEVATGRGDGRGAAIQGVLRRSPVWATRLVGELFYRYAA